MYYDDGNTYTVRVFDDDGKPVKQVRRSLSQ